MVKVRDRRPFETEIVTQFQRVTELFFEGVQVDIMQGIDLGALLDCSMSFSLEDGEIGLAHDRGVGIIHLLEQDVPPDRLIIFIFK